MLHAWAGSVLATNSPTTSSLSRRIGANCTVLRGKVPFLTCFSRYSLEHGRPVCAQISLAALELFRWAMGLNQCHRS
jgi:hypothetical protein